MNTNKVKQLIAKARFMEAVDSLKSMGADVSRMESLTIRVRHMVNQAKNESRKWTKEESELAEAIRTQIATIGLELCDSVTVS